MKAEILSLHGPAAPEDEPTRDEETIVITPPITALLEERRILEDDIRGVLAQVSGGGSSFIHKTSGQRLASAKLGEVTFWVSYKPTGNAIHIDRCWSHRMTIGQGGTS